MLGIEWQSMTRQAPNCASVSSISCRQSGVEGLPACGDTQLRVGKTKFAGVNFLAAADDPGDRAKASADPGADRFYIIRQAAGEHFRVKFPGLTIDVAPGARKIRRQQRRAERGRRAEQLLDEAVFAAADSHRV